MLDPSGRPAGFLIAFRDVTLRRQAEEILKRYQLLSEYAHDIILFVRSDGRIIEANDAALLTYGYRRDELLAMTIADLRVGDSQETIAKQMDLADKGGVIFETVHRGKNGKHIQVEVSSRGVTIGNERVLLSIVRDITERKSGEETLRSKNKELSIISRITAIINRSATMEEILEGTLQGSLELLEMDAGAIYLANPADGTKLVLRSFVPRTEAGFAAEPRKSVKADPALNAERIFCFADGGTPLFRDIFTSRPADVIVPVLLKGFAVGFMAFCSEAGAPKRGELPDLMSIGAQLGIAIDNHTLMRTLRATSNYMAEIINESPDAILTADARGNIISANKRAARLLQYDMMELAGMNVAQLLPQDAPGLTLAGD
jgi:PAS domain S-box-containing protein